MAVITPDGPDGGAGERGLGAHVVDVGGGLGHLDHGDEEQADERHGERRRQLHPDRDPAHVHPPRHDHRAVDGFADSHGISAILR